MAPEKHAHRADENCAVQHQNERKERKETADALKEQYKSEIEEIVK